jgi:hypothetical protein
MSRSSSTSVRSLNDAGADFKWAKEFKLLVEDVRASPLPVPVAPVPSPPVRPVRLLLVPSRERLMPRVRKNRDMTGPRVGRQAETMPADISMAVQPTVGARV